MDFYISQLFLCGLTILPLSSLVFLAMLYRLRRVATLKRFGIASGTGLGATLLLFLEVRLPPPFSSWMFFSLLVIAFLITYPLLMRVMGPVWGINYPEQEFLQAAATTWQSLESLIKSPQSLIIKGEENKVEPVPIILLTSITSVITLLGGFYIGRNYGVQLVSTFFFKCLFY